MDDIKLFAKNESIIRNPYTGSKEIKTYGCDWASKNAPYLKLKTANIMEEIEPRKIRKLR